MMFHWFVLAVLMEISVAVLAGVGFIVITASQRLVSGTAKPLPPLWQGLFGGMIVIMGSRQIPYIEHPPGEPSREGTITEEGLFDLLGQPYPAAPPQGEP